LLFAALSWGLSAVAADPVRVDLNAGRADAALETLDSALARDPADAGAHNLRCRVYYEEERWDAAVADCEAAVQSDPSDSNFHLWLARAYGQRAAHISMVSAYKFARKAGVEFQRAVDLDPRNVNALSDLGEFDVDAPAIVGGGAMRAQAIVAQLQPLSPAAASTLRAHLAEAKKDYPAAEAAFKTAIAQMPHPADAWMDLASFYRRHGRIDDMLAAVHTGAALDRHHGSALVDGASNLILARREPQTAITWLQEYLNSGAQSEDAPVFVVRAQLARLLAEQGDNLGAQQQLAAARSLAAGYHGTAKAGAAAAAQ
jgi:tetratricopeptide (TPR) repeat protein